MRLPAFLSLPPIALDADFTLFVLIFFLLADVGNGQYEAAYGGLGAGAPQQQFGQPQQAPAPSYGATNM